MQLVRHYKDELDKLEYNRNVSGNKTKHMNVRNKRYNFTYFQAGINDVLNMQNNSIFMHKNTSGNLHKIYKS